MIPWWHLWVSSISLPSVLRNTVTCDRKTESEEFKLLDWHSPFTAQNGSEHEWHDSGGFSCPVVHFVCLCLLQGAPGGELALISAVSSLGNSLCPSGAVTHFLPMAHLILSAARAYSSLFPSAAAKLVTKTSEDTTLLEVLSPFLQHIESFVCEALWMVWHVRKSGEKKSSYLHVKPFYIPVLQIWGETQAIINSKVASSFSLQFVNIN